MSFSEGFGPSKSKSSWKVLRNTVSVVGAFQSGDANRPKFPKKAGYLEKKGDDLFGRYRKRHFDLQNNCLSYSKTPSSKELGHIPLQGAELQLDGKLMYIRKPGSERIFVLRAGDEEEAAEWMDAIQQSQLTPQQIASYDAEQRQSKTARVTEALKRQGNINEMLSAPPVQQLQMEVETSGAFQCAVPRGSFEGCDGEMNGQCSLQEIADLSPTSTKRRMLRAEAATIFEDADKNDEGELSKTALKQALQSDDALHKNCPTVLTCLCSGDALDGVDETFTCDEFCDFYIRKLSEKEERQELQPVDLSPQSNTRNRDDSLGSSGYRSPRKSLYGNVGESNEDDIFSGSGNILNEQLLSEEEQAEVSIYTNDPSEGAKRSRFLFMRRFCQACFPRSSREN